MCMNTINKYDAVKHSKILTMQANKIDAALAQYFGDAQPFAPVGK